MNVCSFDLVLMTYFILFLEFKSSLASLTLPLEHSLDAGQTFKQIRTIALHPSAGILTLEATGFSMTEQDEQKLLDLSRKNDLYHVRIRLSDSDVLESSVPACQLVGSAMKAKLVVSVNDHGSPIAVHLATSLFECHPAKISSRLPTLSLTLDVQRPTVGASPETLRYLQRLEKQREEMARAEQGDNRSFFAKYWTYIVPAVILFLVISSVQEAGSSGGNGGGGGAGGR
ncbi:hypothetical protein D915_009533 [Fasciola hepatica]|uniref:ER membrane protein complex subunit 10 n=1 Tax=Fasciola hepatica TaxID=6192 RepID=A0A4E0QXG1_FASHE|nr:hypothetical protein D915_009533 [Fasciola hepatica]